ncbi:hypothetical protein M0R01_04990, partial [bacterium]|nr:hypothetical protein [bacterium]
MKKDTKLHFNKNLYDEVKSWVIWSTVQYPETVIHSIVGLACREYEQGWNDAKKGLYCLQHKYNKTPKRKEQTRHRYHKRINK